MRGESGRVGWKQAAQLAGAAFALATFGGFEANGQTIKLNNAPIRPTSSTGVDPNFTLIEGGNRVVYAGELTTIDSDLYVASTAAPGTQVQLTANQPVVNGFQTDYMTTHAVSPDGSMVVFGRRIAENSTYALRRVLISAPQVELTLSQDIGVFFEYPIVINSDASRVVFMTRRPGNDFGIYSTSTAALGTPVRISSPFLSSTSLESLFLVNAPSGTRAVYVGSNLINSGLRDIVSTPINAAGGQVLLNSVPVEGGSVNDSSLAPVGATADGTSIIFSGDHVVNNVVDLYKASPSAAGTQTKLSSSLNPDGDVLGFLLAPLTNRVFYLADLFQDNKYIVFEASTNGPANQRAVYYPTPNYLGIRQVSLSPDENYLILRGSLTSSGVDDLYTAPTTFQFAPRRVTQLASTDDVTAHTVSPDGTFIAYTQSGPPGTQNTLWVVSTTGQFAPVKIGPASADLRVATFKISPSPNDPRVVYTAFVPTANSWSNSYDLYSVPVPPLNTVANPIPAAAAEVIPVEPAPGPGVGGGTNLAPTLAVTGNKKVKTTGKPVKLRGIATDDREVVTVVASYKKVSASGKKKTVIKRAKLKGGAWRFTFKPKTKVTKLTFQSIDAQGLRSPVSKVKVTRLQ